MNCAGCGRANPEIARFCAGCGKPLALRCPACGAEHEADARFCIACGAPLAARSPAAAEKAIARKVVTVVFADLIGSVSLQERLDAESARRVMDHYHRAMTAAVEVHGGRVVQLLGDGVLAAFGVPRVAEDDAIRAVRAGVGMQRAFRELVRELGAPLQGVGLRVALNTGEVVVSDDETALIGDPTNVAARLQHEARDGDVLIGEATQRLVADLVILAPAGTFALRGRSETVTAYRVVSLDRPADARATAFVGRDDELQRLSAVYSSAVAASRARLAVLLGSPGLGKSRLVAEFTRRTSDRATVLTARCDASGGATFAPLADALRLFLGIEEGAGSDALHAAIDAVAPGDEAERARIADGIGALFSGAAFSPEETFFAVRRLLAALAAVRPVVLVIDDLQWAEPLLFDLVEHLVQWSTGVPLFILVAARPELREARSSFATPGTVVADVITLAGLDAAASMRLAAGVLGAGELPAALVGRVLATSEGNPLFLGELVRMLVHDGVLVREGERWVTTVEVSTLDMPPTIQVLLAARIERLRPEERIVLERAAVIGRQFSRSALAHLLRDGTGDLDARLEALRRTELVEADTGWFLGEPALRFHHVLIRDAAYRRVLKETRAELHERLADWIIGRAGESVEHDETIGFHLEQAHQNRLELGPLDARERTLGERAARHLGAAGKRALARDELLPAANLLGRALDRLDREDPAGADLALHWCEALLSAGDVGSAAKAIDELGRFCTGAGDGGPEAGDSRPGTGEKPPSNAGPSGTGEGRLRAWHTCFAGQLAVLTDPQSLRASEAAVAAAAEVLTAAGDDAGEAKARSVHALTLARLGRVAACEAALDQALAAARRAGDRRRANTVLSGAPPAALWGPSPVTRASGRCLDVVRVLRITQGAPVVEATALSCQGVLEALRGRTDAARRMIASAREKVEELGIANRLFEADVFAARIEVMEGNVAAAEHILRGAYEGLRDLGLGIDAAQAGALLARTLLMQDRAAEAEALSHESEALAGDDLQAAIAWRGVRAEALARRGEYSEAIELAKAAVAIASATDALLDHAGARMALATALRAAGRGAEADAEERHAVALWKAKGATRLVEQARTVNPDHGRAAHEEVEKVVSASAVRRRAQPNRATLGMARFNAAVAARDLAAARELLREAEVVDLPLGRSYAGDALVEVFGSMFERTADVSFHIEPIATLGPALALTRWRESGSEVVGDDLSIGAYELVGFSVAEAHSETTMARVEVFSDDCLGDAVVRLYERYAQRLPQGWARNRAMATSHSVATLLREPPHAAPFALDAVATDHRTAGFGSLRGRDAIVRALESFRQLSENVEEHIDDVLDLRSDALLARWTTSGTIRASGGAFDQDLCQLFLFGADGLLARWEQFDAWQEAEALVRFDELNNEQPARAARRMRPNAASATTLRINAAIAARDPDSLRALHTDNLRNVDLRTGTELDLKQVMEWWSLYFADRDSTLQITPVATLGESLVLNHLTWSGSASNDALLLVGAFEGASFDVVQSDSQGRVERVEAFGPDRLGDAIVRLYERYAELVPEGLARARAAATAHSVALWSGRMDLDTLAASLDPSIECNDHRILGTSSVRGKDGFLRHWRAQFDLTDANTRDDEILALEPNVFLARRVWFGTERISGGVFENVNLALMVFGEEGLLIRVEVFDPDREAEALARFDELTERP